MGQGLRLTLAITALATAGCIINRDENPFADGTDDATAGPGGADASGSGDRGGPTGGSGTAEGTADDTGGDGPKLDVGNDSDGPINPMGDPPTCADAAQYQTYVGCDFWPTITYNPVLTNFDFTVVAANGSDEPAEIVVERDGQMVATDTVAPGQLVAIPLPWVDALKGPQFDAQTTGPRPDSSVRVDGGAYHLESSVPVTLWQFNPLQYTDDVQDCALEQQIGLGESCLSVSNDAALLLPSTAMTGNYRVFGKDSVKGTTGGYDDTPGGIAITAPHDGTEVTVRLVDGAQVVGGSGVDAIAAGGMAQFTLDSGDVLQLLGQPGMFWGDAHSDLSGSLVTADQPVQVISFVALSSSPSPEVAGEGYADHLEETIPPAEVLGDHYVVTPPTSAQGENVGHYVRFYGNFDGTTLEYPGTTPAGAPTTLDAGQVVAFETSESFEVHGSDSFAIGMFVKGGQVQTPGEVPTIGDPAFSLAVPVAQFRTDYIFLAPTDYLVSYADIVIAADWTAELDGQPLTSVPEPIDGTEWVVHREPLGPGQGGAHRLTTLGQGDVEGAPAGLQIMGYGHATAYMMPGGLNLQQISPPPPAG